MPRSEKAEAALTKLKNEAASFEPTFKSFLSQYTGLVIDTIIIWIMFFALGVPTVVKYGYPSSTDIHDEMKLNNVGGIGSGVYGSGIFPVSLFLFIVSTALLIKECICYFKYPSVTELERRIDYMTIERRMSSMRQMSSLSREDMMSVGVDAASLNPAE